MIRLIPGFGFNEVEFGLTGEDVRELLGNPNDCDLMDQYEIWDFTELGVSLFFEKQTGLLEQVEIEDVPVSIWGVSLMGKSCSEILEVIKKNTSFEVKIFDRPAPTLLYVVDGLGLDFDFEDKRLCTITARIGSG